MPSSTNKNLRTEFYSPDYSDSWALIIGINEYQYVSPLHYARQDAKAVADILINQFDFEESNVRLLLDENATQNAIRESYFELTCDVVKPNDRILFYFAGHGYTHLGNRGDVGFLIPVDGQKENLATFIGWNELTYNAELIPAKHLLFIMDACYGGLAITRTLSPGSMRFLKDMLQRYSRQVITAGKADEPVLDAGGPLPEHSVFTGHLLMGLQGGATTSDGILTANGVMSYVYEKVSKDRYSRQTPHFGFLDGDGDFVFDAPPLRDIPDEPETEQDILVEVPITLETELEIPSNSNLIDVVKEYISGERYRIKLDDLVVQHIKKVKAQTTDGLFPIEMRFETPEKYIEEFSNRLKRYESLTQDLQIITTLLAHWGDSIHLAIIRKIMARTSEWPKHQSGQVLWLNLRCYPTVRLIYSAGIGAIASGNYESLYAIFNTKAGLVSTHENTEEVIIKANKAILEVIRSDVFKKLPGHERQYVPNR